MKKKNLCIIPARRGSKGIPFKNIQKVCGKPLIEYSISDAKESKLINRIIVSTDSKKIASIVKVSVEEKINEILSRESNESLNSFSEENLLKLKWFYRLVEEYEEVELINNIIKLKTLNLWASSFKNYRNKTFGLISIIWAPIIALLPQNKFPEKLIAISDRLDKYLLGSPTMQTLSFKSVFEYKSLQK